MNHYVVALALSFVACAARVGAQAPAQPADQPVVVASGAATVRRAPDRAFVSIAAESRARTSKEAQSQNAAAMNAGARQAEGVGSRAGRHQDHGVRPPA